MDDQTEVVTGRPADPRSGESPQQAGSDRTYIAWLEFLTQMHTLRWEVSDAAVVTNSLGEERVRIGTVSVPVLEKFTELLRRHHDTTTAESSAPGKAGREE